MQLITIILGYILDLIFGDPYSFPHPVRYIGKLGRYTEKKVRQYAHSPKALKIGGGILWLIVVGLTYAIVFIIVRISSIHPVIYLIVNSFLIYTTLAAKCLKDEAVKIYKVLKSGTIEEARVQLSYIVGRDTKELNQTEIIKATVETVAENTVDGVIAPLFYVFIGGAPLAFMYKAINTLDSMIGYQNEKYGDIGFVSAKIDDVANFIPARLTSFLMMIACFFLKLDAKWSIRIAIRDRKNHKSPNCAYPEGSVAGALGVQLGGTHHYFGKEVYKPTIGDAKREVVSEDILKTNQIMYLTTFIGLILFSVVSVLITVLILKY